MKIVKMLVRLLDFFIPIRMNDDGWHRHYYLKILFWEWRIYVKEIPGLSMDKPNFQNILKHKLLYYGRTEAAYEFAAEEYANRIISYAKR